MNKKIGVIDVGGGCRGVYAAGVFDYFLDNNITFDLGIGVSAGSANIASFTAKQDRRNYKFYTEYALRPEYMGMKNFIAKKSFIDLDYVYGTLTNDDGEYPIDYDTYMDNTMEFYIVATNAITGDAHYFNKNEMQRNQYDAFKASSCIPFVCPPYIINDIPYYDGALADPVPIQKAFDWGCDKVVLILTLPIDTIRDNRQDTFLAKRIQKKYPLAAEKLMQRANLYNTSIQLAKEYENKGKLLIIAPNDTCGVSTLSRNQDDLIKLYDKGYLDGAKINNFTLA
ncbi:MAG: patatin family protein [Agathobacter sp.]|nr:patatin family protein [Agathobacter sp.]